MGCDIHMVLEVKDTHTGGWVGLHSFPFFGPARCTATAAYGHRESGRGLHGPMYFGWEAMNRNYPLFNLIAGVRGDGTVPVMYEPRGVPDDASDLTQMMVADWGEDGHTPSWLTLREFAIAHITSLGDTAEAVAEKLEGGDSDPVSKRVYDLFGLDEDRVPDDGGYRVVFWFDN